MSSYRTSRAGRAALSFLAAGALAGGLLGSAPASAAPSSDLVKPARTTHFEDGRYIVVLRAPGATTYEGGDARFDATRPRGGSEFDSSSSDVREYTSHLRRTHRDVASDVGADVTHDYTTALNGFVSVLTGDQAAELARDRRVLLVSPDKRIELDTWASPDHLGLTGKNGAWARHGGAKRAGAGTVVGIIDSGIWPESKSFSGRTLTSEPTGKWDIHRLGDKTYMDKRDGTRFQGECMTGEGWEPSDCNAKLIGARYYPEIFEAALPEEERSELEFLSPRDGDGHGTHTASTAAGNRGVLAEVEGRRFGRISGMAPAARIAAYKVCYSDQDPNTGDCYTSASVAAIDDAVADGVDSLNFSISGATDTVVDEVELAFHGASAGGVFVATSAGNSGPDPETVAHASPWLTTVAASTHVAFENTVVLGNGKKFVGASINSDPVPQTPLIDSKEAAATGATVEDAELCVPDSLDPEVVEGKIVVCTRGAIDRVAKSAEVARAGGVGMILANPTPNSLDADFHSVPSVHVDDTAAAKIWQYLEAADYPSAAFKPGNITNKVTPVPQIAGFSSRGPSLASDADILKPDIAAPGVSVLAAVAPPSNSDRDFDLYSGTSMASPHIAGLAAFIMSQRPSWTPMQVKSAMMTTADSLLDENGDPIRDAFAQGAGEVQPRQFFDPGVFITPSNRDFLGFLASQGFGTETSYGSSVDPVAAKDINQPSMALGQVVNQVTFNRQLAFTKKGIWKVSVDVPGFAADVNRKRLVSERSGDIEDLTITFTRSDASVGEFTSGFVTLTGPTTIRIPVALRPVSVKAPAEVTGQGVDGSTPIEVTAGFTGNLDVRAVGLDEAETHAGTVEDTDAGYYDDYCVDVAEGTEVVRADLDALPETGDTLDMYIYVLDGDCATGQIIDYAGIAATGSGDEQFTWTDPPPGSYIVSVELFEPPADASSVDYVLDIFAVDGTSNAGSFGADPNPVPVVAGETTTFDAVWSGLNPDSRYFGFMEYEGALRPTYVTVDTSTP